MQTKNKIIKNNVFTHSIPAVIQSLIHDVWTTYRVVTIIIIINIILGLYVLFPEIKSWQFQLHNYLKILTKSAKMLNYLVNFVGKQQDEFICVKHIRIMLLLITVFNDFYFHQSEFSTLCFYFYSNRKSSYLNFTGMRTVNLMMGDDVISCFILEGCLISSNQ